MNKPKLYMLMLGCRPKGRHTEQHDIFFGIAPTLKALIPDIYNFWPEAKKKIHIDAWREVTCVDGNQVEVVSSSEIFKNDLNLFFINLGGYRPDEFDEPHYKMLLATPNKATAIKMAKKTAFYKHNTFAGATSHIDENFAIDVDDIYEINEVLSLEMKSKYKLKITPNANGEKDEIHLGYLMLKKIK